MENVLSVNLRDVRAVRAPASEAAGGGGLRRGGVEAARKKRLQSLLGEDEKLSMHPPGTSG